MIVVDAAVITCLCVDGELTPLAEAVLARDPVWVAPVLWRSEVRGALMNCLRRHLMSFESIMVSWHMAEEVVGGREYSVDARKVLTLAARSGCGSYDCEYIALAQELGLRLVTTDKQLLKIFPKVTVALEKFAKPKK